MRHFVGVHCPTPPTPRPLSSKALISRTMNEAGDEMVSNSVYCFSKQDFYVVLAFVTGCKQARARSSKPIRSPRAMHHSSWTTRVQCLFGRWHVLFTACFIRGGGAKPDCVAPDNSFFPRDCPWASTPKLIRLSRAPYNIS